ncbi:hypothetical protein IV79_GL000600 [Pediococcus claussenii]|nr:hypothetical protein [Pediococcus claussenii]ANZ69428.1 hypothetical protein AYR57_03495 [Pediococcus claussenii]ANZ71248.1 hypothetical protein AYR58_03510 [Pediococcus claussenii]KRN20542.1 hypothetical protein IV79_GL000600 [Pediococcus claussenii]
MSRHGWVCRFKQKRFNKPGNLYKTFKNTIDRDWISYHPLQELTIDITYLSTIMDTFNSEIIAYQISEHPDTKLALDTLEQLT